GRTGLAAEHSEVHDWYHWSIDLGSGIAYSDVPVVTDNDRNLIIYTNPQRCDFDAMRDGPDDWVGGQRVGFYWSETTGGARPDLSNSPSCDFLVSLPQATVIAGTGSVISNFRLFNGPPAGRAPVGVLLPLGFFTFQISTSESHGVASVTFQLPPDVSANTYMK